MNLGEKLRRRFKLGPREHEDPRHASRLRVPALIAYYWDGSQPSPHGVRDISESGMYIYTHEHWYSGTLILMQLQREDCEEGSPERSIAVLSRAMRWGEDGVGLEFIFADPEKPEKNSPLLAGGAEKFELERFLAHMKLKYGEGALERGSEADRGKEIPALPAAGPGDGGVGV